MTDLCLKANPRQETLFFAYKSHWMFFPEMFRNSPVEKLIPSGLGPYFPTVQIEIEIILTEVSILAHAAAVPAELQKISFPNYVRYQLSQLNQVRWQDSFYMTSEDT